MRKAAVVHKKVWTVQDLLQDACAPGCAAGRDQIKLVKKERKMVLTDPVSDMMVRIKNAIRIKKDTVEMPSSTIKEDIAKILRSEGYIAAYDVQEKRNIKVLRLVLKSDQKKKNIINGLKRVSTPGRHIYVGSSKLPRVQGGFGSAIISTSSGIMTDKQARQKKIGGEVLCLVW